MLYHSKRPTRPKAPALFRDRYEAELHAAELDMAADFESWLREHGIEPTTGKMTDAGVAFFKELLDADNERRARMRARGKAFREPKAPIG